MRRAQRKGLGLLKGTGVEVRFRARVPVSHLGGSDRNSDTWSTHYARSTSLNLISSSLEWKDLWSCLTSYLEFK